jgi:NADH-quinone oxidoreductase subunit N
MTEMVIVALPELVLVVGAMALLMVGAFSRDSKASSDLVGWGAVLVLSLAGGLLYRNGLPSAALFDGAFVNDGFARFAKLLVIGGSIATLLMSFDALARAKTFAFEIPVLVLLATFGMMMMVSAGDLIALYLGIELQSLSLYVLAAARRDDVRSSEAGLKYFVLGALSSGMLLYGASLIYGATGATSFTAIAAASKAVGPQSLTLIVGLVFLLVGLAFKVSAVPFHMWTPDVYQGAPTPITAYFAAAPKVAAFAVLTRVLATAFPGISGQWQQIVIFLAIGSMILGALGAIGQSNIKRLLAYSSIGHVGFGLVGLAAATETGIESVLLYLAIYIVMTVGAFACVLAMCRNDEPVEDIAELGGLAETNLGLAFVFGALLFSLAGVPPLAGFIAKLWVFSAAIKAGLYPLAIIGVIASVVSAYYYLRIVKIMFFDEKREPLHPVGLMQRLVMGLSCLFVIGYVVFPSFLVDAASAAAKSIAF